MRFVVSRWCSDGINLMRSDIRGDPKLEEGLAFSVIIRLGSQIDCTEVQPRKGLQKKNFVVIVGLACPKVRAQCFRIGS